MRTWKVRILLLSNDVAVQMQTIRNLTFPHNTHTGLYLFPPQTLKSYNIFVQLQLKELLYSSFPAVSEWFVLLSLMFLNVWLFLSCYMLLTHTAMVDCFQSLLVNSFPESFIKHSHSDIAPVTRCLNLKPPTKIAPRFLWKLHTKNKCSWLSSAGLHK